jgi:AraC family transcriptional regulator
MEALHHFTIDQTHGILARPEHDIEASSGSLGWRSLYTSIQREQPYQDSFRAVDDHLIILHRDGPVRVERELHGALVDRIVHPGGLFVLPARSTFSVQLGGALSTIHLYVRHHYVQQAARDLVVGDPDRVDIVPRLGERDSFIGNIADTAQQLVRQHVTGDLCPESLAHLLATRLILCHSTAQLSKPLPVEGLSSKTLARLDEFIDDNIDQTISVSDLANAVSLTPFLLSRQLKVAVGQSPHQYLISARVERAKRLLRSTDMPIAEIAFYCGFSHQEHLTRLFGREVGITPAAYRRSQA